MEWFLEGVVSWIADRTVEFMDAMSFIFLAALSPDLTFFFAYFPFLKTAFEVIQGTAIGIILLLCIFSLFRSFFGPITDVEHPAIVVVRTIGAIFMVYTASQICTYALEAAKVPFDLLMDTSSSTPAGTFQSIDGVIISYITSSQVTAIIEIVLILALGINYLKLCLEAVERYVVCGVLAVFSPLAFAAFTTKGTSGVFKGWVRMFFASLLLLSINVIFIRAFNSSVGVFYETGGVIHLPNVYGTDIFYDGAGGVFMWFFCALALLRIGQKADSIMNSMGLSTAITGGSMMGEVMAAGLAFSQGIRMAGRGGSRASSGTSGASGADGMTAVGGARGMSMVKAANINTPGGSAVAVRHNKATGATSFSVLDTNGGMTTVKRTPGMQGQPAPAGAYAKEINKATGALTYRQAEGANAATHLTPQFGKQSPTQGFVLDAQGSATTGKGNEFSGRDVAKMYRDNYNENLAKNMTQPEAAALAHEQTAQDVGQAAYQKSVNGGMSHESAEHTRDQAIEGYQDYQKRSQEMFGNSLGEGTMLENDPNQPGVYHAHSTAPDGHAVEKDLYLQTANSQPEGAFSKVSDTDTNDYYAVDKAVRGEYANSERYQSSQDREYSVALSGQEFSSDHEYSRDQDVAQSFASEQFPDLHERLGERVAKVDYSAEDRGVYEAVTESGQHYRISDAAEYQAPRGSAEVEDAYNHPYHIEQGQTYVIKEPIYDNNGAEIRDESNKVMTRDVTEARYEPLHKATAPEPLPTASELTAKMQSRKPRKM